MNAVKNLAKGLAVLVIIAALALVLRLIGSQTFISGGSKPAPVVYDATGAMLDAVVFSNEVAPAAAARSGSPVYDATGAMLDAIVTSGEANAAAPRPVVYDATGAMLDAVTFSHEVQSAPARWIVYDATGAMLDAVVFPSDPDENAVRAMLESASR